ncbi:glycine N-acyltransferase-like protein [Pimephales promelas]|nr:glycine N-acyltransferase-like protein [Pimephales promelas]
MRQLTTEDLKTLEVDLKNYFPQSLQVYGCIVQLNRRRADPVSVFVDLWPDFRVLLIKPEIRETGDHFKDLTVFSKNDVCLRDLLLAQTDVIDWKMYICLATELHHEKMLEFVAINRGVPMKKEAVCLEMVLREPSKCSQIDRIASVTPEGRLTLTLQDFWLDFDVADRFPRSVTKPLSLKLVKYEHVSGVI